MCLCGALLESLGFLAGDARGLCQRLLRDEHHSSRLDRAGQGIESCMTERTQEEEEPGALRRRGQMRPIGGGALHSKASQLYIVYGLLPKINLPSLLSSGYITLPFFFCM
jgi:hypothetical protein